MLVQTYNVTRDNSQYTRDEFYVAECKGSEERMKDNTELSKLGKTFAEFILRTFDMKEIGN